MTRWSGHGSLAELGGGQAADNDGFTELAARALTEYGDQRARAALDNACRTTAQHFDEGMSDIATDRLRLADLLRRRELPYNATPCVWEQENEHEQQKWLYLAEFVQEQVSIERQRILALLREPPEGGEG